MIISPDMFLYLISLRLVSGRVYSVENDAEISYREMMISRVYA